MISESSLKSWTNICQYPQHGSVFASKNLRGFLVKEFALDLCTFEYEYLFSGRRYNLKNSLGLVGFSEFNTQCPNVFLTEDVSDYLHLRQIVKEHNLPINPLGRTTSTLSKKTLEVFKGLLRHHKFQFVICYDNDEAGTESGLRVFRQLTSLGVPVRHFLTNPDKDLSEKCLNDYNSLVCF